MHGRPSGRSQSQEADHACAGTRVTLTCKSTHYLSKLNIRVHSCSFLGSRLACLKYWESTNLICSFFDPATEISWQEDEEEEEEEEEEEDVEVASSVFSRGRIRTIVTTRTSAILPAQHPQDLNYIGGALHCMK